MKGIRRVAKEITPSRGFRLQDGLDGVIRCGGDTLPNLGNSAAVDRCATRRRIIQRRKYRRFGVLPNLSKVRTPLWIIDRLDEEIQEATNDVGSMDDSVSGGADEIRR